MTESMKQAVPHSRQTGKNVFTLPGCVSFSFWILSFCGFLSLKFFSGSASIFVSLNFCAFQQPHLAAISVLAAKVISGIDGNARSSLLFSGKISNPAVVFFRKTLQPLLPYLFKRPKLNSFSSWIRIKTKNKTDVRATVATKFVAWEVPKLKNLQVSKVYRLRIKLNNGGKLSREEKDWHTRAVNSNSYFKSAVPKHFQRHEIIRFPQKTRKKHPNLYRWVL